LNHWGSTAGALMSRHPTITQALLHAAGVLNTNLRPRADWASSGSLETCLLSAALQTTSSTARR